MPSEIVTEVVHRGGMRFEGRSRSGRTVELDFAPPGEPVEGYTPLELLLASLAACSGQVTAGLLKRMGQEIAGFRVVARGVKKDVHPTVLTSVVLEFEFTGRAAGAGLGGKGHWPFPRSVIARSGRCSRPPSPSRPNSGFFRADRAPAAAVYPVRDF